MVVLRQITETICHSYLNRNLKTLCHEIGNVNWDLFAYCCYYCTCIWLMAYAISLHLTCLSQCYRKLSFICNPHLRITKCVTQEEKHYRTGVLRQYFFLIGLKNLNQSFTYFFQNGFIISYSKGSVWRRRGRICECHRNFSDGNLADKAVEGG